MPSIKELSILYSGDLNSITIDNQYSTQIHDIVNVSIKKVSGVEIYATCWSSSEHTIDSALRVTFDSTSNMIVEESSSKNSIAYIRPILAF
ncbi:MAG: hypothetical protein ACK5M3_06905 [Dysgonomonas sp.]